MGFDVIGVAEPGVGCRQGDTADHFRYCVSVRLLTAERLAAGESNRGNKTMEVQLTDDQKCFVRDGIADGRFQREEDALQEALLLWEERERRRAEIMAAVDAAEASLARGEGLVITEESMRQLASEVKARSRERWLRDVQGL